MTLQNVIKKCHVSYGVTMIQDICRQSLGTALQQRCRPVVLELCLVLIFQGSRTIISFVALLN